MTRSKGMRLEEEEGAVTTVPAARILLVVGAHGVSCTSLDGCHEYCLIQGSYGMIIHHIDVIIIWSRALFYRGNRT